ncbi:tyrosine-type recombinase/integrase [Pseudobacillus badius]|uniref:site-specific integrase n=1 Tax=Bacillus badius TaxID=1455 RepID=UPI0007B06EC7|nr:tyrosine-type recombinase/integrase [Bacillus badius]KZO00431.1 integrase [Bacillus badius]OCS86740.1 integrase [Bacillus badius]OVE46496.1 site-specific integrase [Bacillus badius]TDV97970.1 site-specific recombinase XerD [Bacillus badius]
MASYQKRGNSWQYVISNVVNGKAKPIRKSGFRTKKEAQIAAAEVEAQLSKGVVPSLKKMPFDEYFENWIKIYKEPKVSLVTLEHYKYSLKAVKEYFQNKEIKDIKRQHYQIFLNWLGKEKAKETVAKINGHIKACVKDAIEEQLIQIDFTRKTELTWTVQAKKSTEKHLNYEESERLLQSLWDKLDKGLGYSLLLLAITSGMRYEELIGLTRTDFDFVNNTITINKTWGYKKNSPKGFGPTKNEQSIRTIKMDKKTMSHFRELFKSTPTNIKQLVFYSPSSMYKVISNTNANKLLKKLLAELKIHSITVHGLRHTHGSVLLYKKASIQYVSERLGHGDIETTLKVYTHVLKELRIEDEQLSTNTFEQMIV